jgi:hypothetical protein
MYLINNNLISFSLNHKKMKQVEPDSSEGIQRRNSLMN